MRLKYLVCHFIVIMYKPNKKYCMVKICINKFLSLCNYNTTLLQVGDFWQPIGHVRQKLTFFLLVFFRVIHIYN